MMMVMAAAWYYDQSCCRGLCLSLRRRDRVWRAALAHSSVMASGTSRRVSLAQTRAVRLSALQVAFAAAPKLLACADASSSVTLYDADSFAPLPGGGGGTLQRLGTLACGPEPPRRIALCSVSPHAHAALLATATSDSVSVYRVCRRLLEAQPALLSRLWSRALSEPPQALQLCPAFVLVDHVILEPTACALPAFADASKTCMNAISACERLVALGSDSGRLQVCRKHERWERCFEVEAAASSGNNLRVTAVSVTASFVATAFSDGSFSVTAVPTGERLSHLPCLSASRAPVSLLLGPLPLPPLQWSREPSEAAAAAETSALRLMRRRPEHFGGDQCLIAFNDDNFVFWPYWQEPRQHGAAPESRFPTLADMLNWDLVFELPLPTLSGAVALEPEQRAPDEVVTLLLIAPSSSLMLQLKAAEGVAASQRHHPLPSSQPPLSKPPSPPVKPAQTPPATHEGRDHILLPNAESGNLVAVADGVNKGVISVGMVMKCAYSKRH